jgi:4'-phosphopantetheinyl transferase EntD
MNADVVVRATTEDLDGPLFPEELAVISHSIARRQAEFQTTRLLAHDALQAMGHPPEPLLPGRKGEPMWPLGVVGSITHCAGFRAVAVSHSPRIESLGIDAEPMRPLPPGVLGRVSNDAERESLHSNDGANPRVPWDCVLFSAKEAVYKAWYPMAQSWLGFRDVEIILDVREQSFTAELLIAPPSTMPAVFPMKGRWTTHSGLVLTAAIVQSKNI